MEKKMIKLELTVEQVQLILGALSQLPYATSATLIELVKTTAEAQLKEIQSAQTDKTKQ